MIAIECQGSKDAGVESVTLFNSETNETSSFPTQGVFIAIGHQPNSQLFRGQLDMDGAGYLLTGHHEILLPLLVWGVLDRLGES